MRQYFDVGPGGRQEIRCPNRIVGFFCCRIWAAFLNILAAFLQFGHVSVCLLQVPNLWFTDGLLLDQRRSYELIRERLDQTCYMAGITPLPPPSYTLPVTTPQI
jgi:hypothetical protein